MTFTASSAFAAGAPIVQPSFVLVDARAERRERPLFSTAVASDSLLQGLRPDGAPARKEWHPDRLEATKNNLFRLKAVDLPELPQKVRGVGRSKSQATMTTNSTLMTPMESHRGDAKFHMDSSLLFSNLAAKSTGSLPGIPEQVAPQKETRAQRYYRLLMEGQEAREERNRKIEQEAEKGRRGRAAERAKAAAIERVEGPQVQEPGTPSSSSSASSNTSGSRGGKRNKKEEKEPEEEESDGELVAYEGVMKVDLGLIVMRAPDGDAMSEVETHPSSGSSSESDSEAEELEERLDLSELEALQRELGEQNQEQEDDEAPRRLRRRRWPAPDARWALSLGGAVVWLPDVKRYAHMPSLPPPPPPNERGRHRMHMKPRLPLDISRGRYKDEQPGLFGGLTKLPVKLPPPNFEEKYLAWGFYNSCHDNLLKLPAPQLERDVHRHQMAFSKLVGAELSSPKGFKMDQTSKPGALPNFSPEEKRDRVQKMLAQRRWRGAKGDQSV